MFKSALESLTPRRRGMARGRDTPAQILDAAEELLQRRGYNAFSYHHIAVRLGMRNAAIHYHFPAKEDLGVALIKRYQERFRLWAEEAAQLDCAWVRLRAYFKTYLKFLEADCRCCPGGMLGAEFDSIPEVMREESRRLMRQHYDWLTAVLEQGRSKAVLNFSGRAEDKAAEIGAALQGGLQIARLAGPERFHQVLAQLSQDLTGSRSYASALAS